MKLKTLLSAILFCGAQPAFAGKIAITFDDAPTHDSASMSGEQRTGMLISELQRAGVKDVAFFVKTKNLSAQSSSRLKQYENAGFHLANHSHSHASANKIPVNNFLVDVRKADARLREYDSFIPFFRFPYLHEGKDDASRERLQQGLEAIGYKNGYVTVDNYDWYLNSKYVDAVDGRRAIDLENLRKLYVDMIWDCIKFYDELAVSSLGESPKHVLLLHENDMAAMFVGDLVRRIRGEGWEIISPEEAYKDKVLVNYKGKLTFNKQGRVAAIADARGVAREKLRHPSENTDYIDELLVKYKVFE